MVTSSSFYEFQIDSAKHRKRQIRSSDSEQSSTIPRSSTIIVPQANLSKDSRPKVRPAAKPATRIKSTAVMIYAVSVPDDNGSVDPPVEINNFRAAYCEAPMAIYAIPLRPRA